MFQCRDEGPNRAPIRWERGNGLPMPRESRTFKSGRLEIPNIQVGAHSIIRYKSFLLH